MPMSRHSVLRNKGKVLKELASFIAFALILVLLVGWGIPDQFKECYERPIVSQYDYFRTLGGGKIILIGGSSISFGTNLDLLEELTGRPCAILGNHAQYGLVYFLEMSKSNLRSGDIVVLEFLNMQLDTCNLGILLSGIGHRYDMYRFLYPALYDKFPEAYTSYLKMSFAYWTHGGYHTSGVYSAASYDKRGNMIYSRKDCTIPYPFTDKAAETYGYCQWSKFEMEPAFREYLNEYIDFCSKRDVKVYITHGPRLDESLITTMEDLDAYDQSIRDQLNAPLISKMRDYIFPRDLIYDYPGHCNDKGAIYRTKLLYRDLQPYL